MIGKLGFFITHSINDLRVNKQRTLFALLCIAASVAAMVSLQTLAVMINDTLTGSLQESNRGDLRLTPSSNWGGNTTELSNAMFSNVAFNATGRQRIQDWFDEKYPGTILTYRQPLDGFGVGWTITDLDRDTDKSFIMNFIIEAAKYPVYGSVKSLDGQKLGDLLQAPTDIVLSVNLAEDLEAKIGDTVRIGGASQDFTVRGIVPTDSEAGFSNSGMGFLAGLFGFYYLDVSATPLFDGVPQGLAAEMYVRLADPSLVDEAQRRFDLNFRSVSTTSTTDLKDQNVLISERVDDLVSVMGLVSLLIGGIGIVNTMLVIVSRRTTEVAVLKTLGLTPAEVTVLFLVEAIMMGVLGSLAGIVMGWGLAYLTKGFAENFLGQSLAFTLAVRPAITGFVVGIIITAIFGFLPTLAAGQVRPATVLRPSDVVIPKAGRLGSFAGLVLLIMLLSLVAQSLMGDLLSSVKHLDTYTTSVGAAYGVLIAVPLVLADANSLRIRRRRRSVVLHALGWLVMLAALPAGAALFGRAIPALLILTGTAIFVGYMYILFWMLIWALGGGRIGEIWPGILVLLFPMFWPLIPVMIVLLLPLWLLGQLIQRLSFVDLKIAMRGMLSTKGRGASTLLALVIGIFTLSVITMLVDTITTAFQNELEKVTGGNLIVFIANGESETLNAVRDTLIAQGDAVKSFALVASYDTQLTGYTHQGRAITGSTLTRLHPWFNATDGREITSNLPDITLIEGRNLDPAQDSVPDADGTWSAVVLQPGSDSGFAPSVPISVGDLVTLSVRDGRSGATPLTFRIVGLVEDMGLSAGGDANIYAPIAAFDGYEPNSVVAIANVEDAQMHPVRRALSAVPGTFALETRFVNDLVNRIVDQFTSFPILVALLALFTGGFVIANSVALSTMERRREIGVMKAVGLQRERVLGMLLLENGLMGVIGGLIGVGVSFVISILILVQIFEGELGKALPYEIAFALMGLCIAISLVAAILSVWSASGEKPLNTLRYE